MIRDNLIIIIRNKSTSYKPCFYILIFCIFINIILFIEPRKSHLQS